MVSKSIVSAYDGTIYNYVNIVSITPYDYSIDVETVNPRPHNSCANKFLAKGSKEYIKEMNDYIVKFMADDSPILDLSKFKVY